MKAADKNIGGLGEKGRARVLKFASMLVVVLALFVVGCDDYDKWTTTGELTFSVDTVAFDTLITDQSSATKTLIVFNHQDRGMRISRVALAMGSASPFRVNMDGQYLAGGAGTDFEVRGNDSIYARLEVKLPVAATDSITPWQDELLFTLEDGRVQKVVLTASGMNVTILRGEVISADRTLSADRPYLIYDSLYVAPGVTLTLPEGTTLMFHDGVSLMVHGRLVANGTLQHPVVFRGDRTDRLFPYLPYDNTPNRWGGIHFYADSKENRLTQCDIHSGDYGILCDSTGIDESTPLTLTLENSIVHNIGGPGLTLNHCLTLVTGTQLSNTQGRTVDLMGGAHQFIHCTIAQFYPFSADRGDALYIANIDDTGTIYRHLYYCDFVNCVITGYAEDVVMGNITEDDQNPCDYLFRNCLLRTVVSDDAERFQAICYDNPDSLEVSGKDHFVLFDTENFLYDFAPDSLSSIRGLADHEAAALYPMDRRGISRLADGLPDAGAYEGK